ncbi:MAG: COX15/CtaA family protein [Rhodoferax sp.]|nr:COX15/CtaA family protein [Rhodoferax sp.]
MQLDTIDWSALLRLALVGLALAAGPLIWLVWRQRKAQPLGRLQGLTVLTLFLTFDLVLFGAFTRLTDSGLGCPDWPGCYGHASPVGAQADIALAQASAPDGPVTHGKAWIEMVHRYLASSVGLLILVLAVSAWVLARRKLGERLINPWWATVTLVWVCLQGAFGAWTVTMKLFPAIVSLHLLGGYVLLALLAVQAVRQSQMLRAQAPLPVSGALRLATLAAIGVLLLQVLSGAWVSTNYAVLACAEFPSCQGSWWPAMDFAEGFSLWRPLGLAADGTPLSFQALTAIHFSHRLLAVVAVVVLGMLAWRLRRLPALAMPVRCLSGLLVLQVATGLSNVVLGWPILAAVLHTGGAGAIGVCLVWILAATHQHVRRGTVPLRAEKAFK